MRPRMVSSGGDGTIQEAVTPEQLTLRGRLCEQIQSDQGDWLQSVENSIELYHKYTARVFSFCKRNDLGLDSPMGYLTTVTGYDWSTISRMRGDGEAQAILSGDLTIVKSVAADVLRPALPLLKNPEALKSAVVDAYERLPDGERLTAKRVRDSVRPYRELLEETHKPRGAAAHRNRRPKIEKQTTPKKQARGVLEHLSRLLGEAMTAARGCDDVSDDARTAIVSAYQAIQDALQKPAALKLVAT